MRAFAQLFSHLELSNKTGVKVAALTDFLRTSSLEDKTWLVALFTGKRPKRPVTSTLMKMWTLEETGIPEWLFVECYSNTGDLSETISLLLPKPTKQKVDKPLHIWMNEIIALGKYTQEEKRAYVVSAWKELSQQERFIFNKLVGGSFRVGVSTQLLVRALSAYSDLETSYITQRIIGQWNPQENNLDDLLFSENIELNLSKPYPFALAYPIENTPNNLGHPNEWQAEYKWDGIRGQIIKRKSEIFIWSRGEDLVTEAFPDLASRVKEFTEDNFVLDGEILPYNDGQILPFSELQKRLNRKIISPKLQKEIPLAFYAYDLLEYQDKDIRHLPLSERRELLFSLIQSAPEGIFPSSDIDFSSWESLEKLQEKSRNLNAEGVMLKRKNGNYPVGRKKGFWWKWKVQPFTLDAVLIYAQKGSGRRSAHYTDYTFAIRKGEELVTIAKAYSGLTDKEIQEISRWVKRNSIEKFGPVRTVKAELIFEIGFEGISESKRHKSGFALRFPRILRWRKDKTIDEIDNIETLQSLLSKN